MHNDSMHSTSPVNACRRCGSTAYRPVIARDASGAMKPTGRYRCIGCKVEFQTVEQWRAVTKEQPTAKAQEQTRRLPDNES